jgi:hypothetical protein
MTAALLPAPALPSVPCRGGCGQRLTDADSIRVGMGPDCAAQHGIWHPRNAAHTRPATTAQGGPNLLDLIGDSTMTNEMPTRPAESAVEARTAQTEGVGALSLLEEVLTGRQWMVVRTLRYARDNSHSQIQSFGPEGFGEILDVIDNLAQQIHGARDVVDAAVTWVDAGDRNNGPDATAQDERDHDDAGDRLEAAARAYLTATSKEIP